MGVPKTIDNDIPVLDRQGANFGGQGAARNSLRCDMKLKNADPKKYCKQNQKPKYCHLGFW